MHFPGIDGDDVAGDGFNVADTTPGAMGADVQDADAEAVMGVPGEGSVGDEGKGLDAGNGGSALLCLMDAPCHEPFLSYPKQSPYETTARLVPITEPMIYQTPWHILDKGCRGRRHFSDIRPPAIPDQPERGYALDARKIESAARNNAAWCDAVCSTHSGPGEFVPGYWLTRHSAPEYYPDLVTLTGASDMARQVDALGEILLAAPGRSLSVKDSFGCLDIGTLGFAPLLDAEWFCASKLDLPVPGDAGSVRWTLVESDADLAHWEQAWRPGTVGSKPRTFRPKLLLRPDIRFVYGLVDDRPIGGGILNATDDVTGLSNVFASGIATEGVLQGLASMAWTWRPQRRLVGYESGADLSAALRVGFEAMGLLRIWHRAGADG